jgi:hypothetical protein
MSSSGVLPFSRTSTGSARAPSWELRIRNWIAQSLDEAPQLAGVQDRMIGMRRDATRRLFPLGAGIESPTRNRS